jgi:hypothetical protein
MRWRDRTRHPCDSPGATIRPEVDMDEHDRDKAHSAAPEPIGDPGSRPMPFYEGKDRYDEDQAKQDESAPEPLGSRGEAWEPYADDTDRPGAEEPRAEPSDTPEVTPLP